MASLVERYVTADSDGGDGSSGNPWTLTEAVAGAAAGDRVNIMSGNYTARGATDAPADGAANNPIVWRGYNSVIGDLDNVGRSPNGGPLVTTNFPVIGYNATYFWDGGTHSLHQNLVFTGTRVGPVAGSSGSSGVFFQCKSTNSSTNTSARAFGNSGQFIMCDGVLDGGSGARAAIYTLGGLVLGCRVVDAPNHGIEHAGAGIVAFNIVHNCGTYGIYLSTTTVSASIIVLHNTVDGCTHGICTPDVAMTALSFFIGNHITNCTYGIYNGYVATGYVPAIFLHNRFRDNSSGDVYGFERWGEASKIGHVTTDTDDTEFVDYAGNDFNLVAAAAGIGTGILKYLDIGALQRQMASGGASPRFGDRTGGLR